MDNLNNNNKFPFKIDRNFILVLLFRIFLYPYHTCRFNDPPQLQQPFARQSSGGSSSGNVSQPAPTGGRWDAILAERQTSNYNSGNSNNYQRGFSGNYNNRNARDNNSGGGGYAGQRDNNYNRRDHESHKPFHSHVGGQSGDATGADWNTPLPSNANLER